MQYTPEFGYGYLHAAKCSDSISIWWASKNWPQSFALSSSIVYKLPQFESKSHKKSPQNWQFLGFFLAVIPGCYSFNIENWWNLFRRLWYGFSTKPSMKERYMFILNTCFESQVIIIQRVSRYFFFRIDPKNRNGARVSAQLTDRKRFISFKDLQSVPLFSFVYYYLCSVVIKNIHSNRHQTFTCRILGWTAELNARESDGIIILVWLQSLQPTSIFEYIAHLGVCVSLCACTSDARERQ